MGACRTQDDEARTGYDEHLAAERREELRRAFREPGVSPSEEMSGTFETFYLGDSVWAAIEVPASNGRSIWLVENDTLTIVRRLLWSERLEAEVRALAR